MPKSTKSVKSLGCPSCRGPIDISKAFMLTICPHCDAIVRVRGSDTSSPSAERLRGGDVEEALEDLKRARAALRSGVTERSRLYGCLTIFMQPKMIGPMGFVVALVILFAVFGRDDAETFVLGLVLALLIGLPLLLLAVLRLRGWLRFGPQIREMDRIISLVSDRLADLQAATGRPPSIK